MRFEWGLVALAFLARLAAVLWLSDTVPYSDFLLYHAAGIEIARDPGFLFEPAVASGLPQFNLWPPGYPLFLASIYSFLGADYRAAVLLQVLLGTLVCWLVYRVASNAGGATTGKIAGLFVALDPSYVFLTNQIASENLFVLWLALALWLIAKTIRDRRSAYLLGITLGLGAMTRAIGLVLPLVIVPWLRGNAANRRAWLSHAAWLLLGLATVLVPWTLRNLSVTGHPAIICHGGGLNFYFGHNAEGIGYRDLEQTPFASLRDPAAIDAAAYQAGWSFIATQPLSLFSNGARKIVALYGFPDYALHVNSGILIPDARGRPELEAQAREKLERQRRRDRLLHGPLTFLGRLHSMALLALGLAGMLVAIRRDNPILRLCLWLVLGWTVAHVFFWAQPRFRYPMDVPLAILAAAALVQVFARLRGSGSRPGLSGSSSKARLAP
jgi:4-amino-4-deoxy-L-arabinose transferase-like glycosyltransferase